MGSLDKTAPKASWNTWMVMGLIGLLATGAGAFVPGMMPEDQPASPVLNATAGDSLDYTPPAMPDFPSPRAMLLRLVLGTVVVLILCVVTLFAAKRWLGPMAQLQRGGQELRLLETLSLNGRCSVYLLQAGKTRALAGVDASGLKVLLALTEPFEETLADSTSVEESQAELSLSPRAA